MHVVVISGSASPVVKGLWRAGCFAIARIHVASAGERIGRRSEMRKACDKDLGFGEVDLRK